MARPFKLGLDYFPISTHLFEEMTTGIIRRRHGFEGECVMMRIYSRIYDNGYYLEWNDDSCGALSTLMGGGIDEKLVQDVVELMVERGVFDREMYTECGVLTSREIQQVYVTATARRRFSPKDMPYWLTDEQRTATPASSRTSKSRCELRAPRKSPAVEVEVEMEVEPQQQPVQAVKQEPRVQEVKHEPQPELQPEQDRHVDESVAEQDGEPQQDAVDSHDDFDFGDKPLENIDDIVDAVLDNRTWVNDMLDRYNLKMSDLRENLKRLAKDAMIVKRSFKTREDQIEYICYYTRSHYSIEKRKAAQEKNAPKRLGEVMQQAAAMA